MKGTPSFLYFSIYLSAMCMCARVGYVDGRRVRFRETIPATYGPAVFFPLGLSVPRLSRLQKTRSGREILRLRSRSNRPVRIHRRGFDRECDFLFLSFFLFFFFTNKKFEASRARFRAALAPREIHGNSILQSSSKKEGGTR